MDRVPRDAAMRVEEERSGGIASESRALVPLGGGRPVAPESADHRPSARYGRNPRSHADASFLAQLIATHHGLQQTRSRARVEPDAGADAYDAHGGRLPPPRGRFSTYI